MMQKIEVCLCLLLAMTVVLSGCTKKTVAIKTDAVSGVVTMDGSPLVGATVTFSPTGADGSVATGLTDSDGKYVLQTLLGNPGAGTTPGEYLVSVSKKENVSTGKQEMSESDGKMIDIMEAKERVPVKFTNKKTSPFKATVVSGQPNSFDFNVSK